MGIGANEEKCQRCGGQNLVWFADSDRWNLAMGQDREAVVCPGCFVKAHEEASGMEAVWRLVPDGPFRWPA